MKLKVEDLYFKYTDKPVLKGISFHVDEGQFLSVLGANGVGKSTLFRCILGLMPRYDGKIIVNGREVRTLPSREMAKHIAYIPQIAHPTFGYSALDMVLMGTTHMISSISAPKKEQVDLAHDALNRLGIDHLAERDYKHLSGGEQQLVLVARALAQQSRILVMDEPTASLDYGNQLRVLDQVKRLTEDGYTVLLSTHHPQHALSYSNRVLALENGCVAAFGDTREMLTPELIYRLYSVNSDFIDTRHGVAIVPVSFENTNKQEESEL